MEWAIDSLIIAIELQPQNQDIKSDLQIVTEVYEKDRTNMIQIE